jgi:hypothetical protein
MKAVLVGACAFVFLLAMLVPAAAIAAPPGNGLNVQVGAYTCDGELVTVTNSSGASAWIGSTHVLILSLTVTLTPFGGEPRVFEKTFGTKAGLNDDTITCTKRRGTPSETIVETLIAVAAP